MSNVRSINQDDVLGGVGVVEEELSPSEFGVRREASEHDDGLTAPKKKSTLLPLIGGIVVAICIVGFFGWKIMAPYLGGNHRAGNDRETFAPITETVPRPQPFAETVEPQTLAEGLLAQAPSGALTGTHAAQVVAPAAEQQQIQPASQKIVGDKVIVGQASPVTDKPAALGAQAVPTSADEIVQINRRIDGLGTTLGTLKEIVEKLQVEMQKTRAAAAKPASVHAATSTAKPVSPKPAVVVKKPASPVAVVAKKPAEGGKPEAAAIDSKPSGDMQLQAVLQDRAWFKTKTGETITVSIGEELKGVGIVQQIDADSGSVVFPNGVVYR